jgi:hypothetical protein
MAGRIVYAYSVGQAIREGYIKSLRAVVLNPRTLMYVRRGEGDQEIEVTLEEVIRLGEEEADFRRSIVTSTETLNTIVDASIRELNRIRQERRAGGSPNSQPRCGASHRRESSRRSPGAVSGASGSPRPVAGGCW